MPASRRVAARARGMRERRRARMRLFHHRARDARHRRASARARRRCTELALRPREPSRAPTGESVVDDDAMDARERERARERDGKFASRVETRDEAIGRTCASGDGEHRRGKE